MGIYFLKITSDEISNDRHFLNVTVNSETDTNSAEFRHFAAVGWGGGILLLRGQWLRYVLHVLSIIKYKISKVLRETF